MIRNGEWRAQYNINWAACLNSQKTANSFLYQIYYTHIELKILSNYTIPDRNAAHLQCIGSAIAVQYFNALQALRSAYAASTLLHRSVCAVYTTLQWEVFRRCECSVLQQNHISDALQYALHCSVIAVHCSVSAVPYSVLQCISSKYTASEA